MVGRVTVENWSGHPIDEVGGSGEGVTPVGCRHGGFGEEGKTGLHEMTVFALGDAIKLGSVRRGGVVCDATAGEEGAKGYVFAAIIRVKGSNLLFQLVFNKGGKGDEGFFDLRF